MSAREPTGGLFDRGRPYDGQPHTDLGERGGVELVLAQPFTDVVRRADRPYRPQPITLRDIYDAVLVGMLQAYGVDSHDVGSYEDLYRLLDFNGSAFDPVAAAQNASVEIEKRLGIYPNVKETS